MTRTIAQRRGKGKLASHAVDNARERLSSFYEKNKEVIDEYMRLRDEIRTAAQNVGRLEHDLRALVRNLSTFYEQES
jgi:hypothetical protein